MAASFPRVAPGPRDRAALERLREAGRVPGPPEQEADYHGRVVQKPWGFEFLAFDAPDVAVWRLRLNPGHSTSMHCHPRKRTALVVLAGNALCHTLGRRYALASHEVLILEQGVFHATKAIGDGGLDLIEVESPRCKTDLARLSDLYGRVGAGYEGLSDMHTERLSRFDHFSLRPAPVVPGEHLRHVDAHDRYRLALRCLDAVGLVGWSADAHARALIVLQGRLVGEDRQTLAGVGEAVSPLALVNGDGRVEAPILALTLDAPTGARL